MWKCCNTLSPNKLFLTSSDFDATELWRVWNWLPSSLDRRFGWQYKLELFKDMQTGVRRMRSAQSIGNPNPNKWRTLIGEKAGLVQVCFILRLSDQWSKWMQDGCKVYMIPTWHPMNRVSWTLGLFSKPPLGGRPNTNLRDHGTMKTSQLFIYYILLCARTRHE